MTKTILDLDSSTLPVHFGSQEGLEKHNEGAGKIRASHFGSRDTVKGVERKVLYVRTHQLQTIG